jgi:uncharacterized ferritin-like protein (DUF455 family)
MIYNGLMQGATFAALPFAGLMAGLWRAREALKTRYLDLVGSIYIYNEHRGYTALDRVLESVRQRSPGDSALLAAITSHRADERKHYEMFRRWFELRGKMPFFVDRTCGHIDRFVEILFRRRIDALDTAAIARDDAQFERLCRVISLTERRGYRQVETLLNHPVVRGDKVLLRIFKVIEQDEPSHWAPYEGWLKAHGKRDPVWWERLIDSFIHAELLVVKLPVLFLTPRLARRTDWADTHDAAVAV